MIHLDGPVKRLWCIKAFTKKVAESTLIICVGKKVHGLAQMLGPLWEVFNFAQRNHTVNQANQPGSGRLKMGFD